MNDYAVNIRLANHRRGDKWVGIPVIGPILVNGVTPDGALSRVRMHLRSPAGTYYKLDSDATTSPDAPIVIVNASLWSAAIPEVQDFVPTSGVWEWDMEFYEGTDVSPRTFYYGKLTVTEDISK